MKKKMLMLGLLTVVSFILGAAPVMADTNTAVKFSDEQVKLAQLNWNAYVEMTKAKTPELAYAFAGQITTVNPDSVIGKAALIHHFSPAWPTPAADVQLPYFAAFTNNPYFDYYPNYYCTYQYR
ncbi:MAG: hypothetical protein J5367_02725 [Lachnospiraceae bacterium]|nr:hypothetical protein [Lachnospiraceae bacterium]